VESSCNIYAAEHPQVYGDGTMDARGWSRFAFRPGFINFVGEDPIDGTTLLSRVAAGAHHDQNAHPAPPEPSPHHLYQVP